MTYPKIVKVISAKAKTRVHEKEDGSIVERKGGHANWHNNNPGDLKFEPPDNAGEETTLKCLKEAQQRYGGIVRMDENGMAIFETAEAGRLAQIKLVDRKAAEKPEWSIENYLKFYAKDDYAGKAALQPQAEPPIRGDPESLAAAMPAVAVAAGMTRIDSLSRSDDDKRLFAVQGEDPSAAHAMYARVDIGQAARRPLATRTRHRSGRWRYEGSRSAPQHREWRERAKAASKPAKPALKKHDDAAHPQVSS